ncbi:ABC transporter substrate-binding protein [Salipaludibacillus sp. HK11]|uniref:ABC transporter substrate-binding protein n=1 Tax=Salipaludibacillus sp. HK11 TaxID=3394320 RepID=UPI0039FC4689
MRRKYFLALILAALMLVVVACGDNTNNNNGGNEGNDNNNNDNGENGEEAAEDVSGDITVLIHRTDIVDTSFERYRESFNEIYPDVEISFEAITDYEGQVNTRMNTEDYGDVLMIPDAVPIEDAPYFFESLGSTAELSETYLFADDFAYEGETYGLPITINSDGVIYNMSVFEEAGVDEIPSTPEEFIAALQMINDNTDAIPLYTNYGDGWPLDQWEPMRLAIAGDPDFANDLPHNETPFAEGEPHYILYNMMYEAAANGLIEGDPLTTDWESSKQMLADGDIATMVLGSWSYAQITELAANPEDIGFMPFPYTQEDGSVYATVGPDFNIGVNAHTDNSAAAHAWLEFFINDSGYWEDEGGISPQTDDEFPEFLQAYDELGVEFISENPAYEGEEGLPDRVDNAGEVGLWQPRFKQEIIEAGIGNRDDTFDEIMEGLNQRWQEGREIEGLE